MFLFKKHFRKYKVGDVYILGKEYSFGGKEVTLAYIEEVVNRNLEERGFKDFKITNVFSTLNFTITKTDLIDNPGFFDVHIRYDYKKASRLDSYGWHYTQYWDSIECICVEDRN